MRRATAGAACCAVLAWSAVADGEPEAPKFYVGDEALPQDEGGCMDQITNWLDRMQWSGDWGTHGSLRRESYAKLVELSAGAAAAPWLALGVGQALLLYFWWRGDGLEVDVEAGRLSLAMHLASIRYVGCHVPDLPVEIWDHLHCAWRWRHAAMIPSELGFHLARRELSQIRVASELLREAAGLEKLMLGLPHLANRWPAALAINSNSFTFPGPVNRPIWPRRDVQLAEFLEAHAATFQAELEALLSDGRFSGLYWGGEVSLTQFAPRLDDWQMVSLVKNKRRVDRVCQHAPKTCDLLASRPEIMECSAGDAGAAFASLQAGSGLRPHFWNAPRLGFHLGLRTPPGARMHVGGQEVSWEEGRATVFDDTYVHSVVHEGSETRYLLIGWFCHPCDTGSMSTEPLRLEPLCPSRGA